MYVEGFTYFQLDIFDNTSKLLSLFFTLYACQMMK